MEREQVVDRTAIKVARVLVAAGVIVAVAASATGLVAALAIALAGECGCPVPERVSMGL